MNLLKRVKKCVPRELKKKKKNIIKLLMLKSLKELARLTS